LILLAQEHRQLASQGDSAKLAKYVEAIACELFRAFARVVLYSRESGRKLVKIHDPRRASKNMKVKRQVFPLANFAFLVPGRDPLVPTAKPSGTTRLGFPPTRAV
jgi:hypothetical protein